LILIGCVSGNEQMAEAEKYLAISLCTKIFY
jgi:hypothetical protein